MEYLLLLVAFILGFLTDMVWAIWAVAIKNHRPLMAANISVCIFLFSLFYTSIIVEKQVVLIIVYIIGGWLGTYLTVKNHK